MNPQELGECGAQAFYRGRVAHAVVDVINQHGGVMTVDDLSSHESEVITPISTEYKVRLVCVCVFCNMSDRVPCVFRVCVCGSPHPTARDWWLCCCSTSWRTSPSKVTTRTCWTIELFCVLYEMWF